MKWLLCSGDDGIGMRTVLTALSTCCHDVQALQTFVFGYSPKEQALLY
jgi:hypothetical protein